jgi:hypothetical protein
LAKKYTISETALRRLVKQMVSDEIKNQRNHTNDSYIEEQHEDPWFYFGEPQPVENKKNHTAKQNPLDAEFPGWNEPFHPEFDEFDAPPFLNRQQKKK